MDLQQEILSFISCKEMNGALLLTGKWGCGKTFLIRQIANNLNCKEIQANEIIQAKENEGFVVAVISLFGIDSINSLNKKVKENVFYAMTDRKVTDSINTLSKIKTIATSLSSVLKDYSKIAKGMNAALSINLYDFINIKSEIEYYRNDEIIRKKLVLVFDDFERSKINRTDLLGAINDYLENKCIKTILVADEEHIKGREYKEIKEKLISQTIKLTPDYKEILKVIIDTYKVTEPSYKDFLTENIEYITQVFLESKSENLRIFKSFIMDFERVYTAWKSSGIPIDEITGVLYIFGAILFEHKTNNYIRDPEYGFIFARTKLKEKYIKLNKYAYQVSSLEKWIVEGCWDECEFIEEIKKNFCRENLTDDQKFLVYNFWDLEQNYITNGLPIAVEKAYKGDLSCDNLISLLQKIFALKDNKIDLPCKVDYKIMQEGFDKRKQMIKHGIINEPKKRTFSMLDQIDPEAVYLYNSIEKLDDMIYAWVNRFDFISFLKQEGNILRYNLEGKYLESFDSELLDLFISRYDSSDNSKKRDLALSFLKLHFDDPKYSNDDNKVESKTNIETLKHILGERQKSGKDQITIAIETSFIKEIDSLLKKFKV